ncbi:magnesium-transporting ATPase (P-type) [Paenibacillus mucilaginosus]|uniref:CBO0543 family protein n=1 Tax=Paenibacillus mucilaginosus TaxID=61624 RepID=UPI003D1DBDF1
MDPDQAIRLNDANVEQIERLLHEKVQIWAEHIVLTPLWWFGVILSIAPWIVWYCIRERQCTDRILYAGLFVMCISMMLDIVGDQFGYWHYRYNVLPLVPTYFPWDLTLMPVTVMLLLQYKPGANPLLKALFFSLLTSYAAEPFFAWLQVYQIADWRYSYSVPIQFAIYLFAHYLTRRYQFQPLERI